MAEGMKGIGFRIGVVLVGAVLGWTAVGVFRDMVLLPRLPFDLAQAIQAVVTGAVAVAIILAACHVLNRRRVRTLGLNTLGSAARALVGGAGLWVLLAAAALLVGVLVGAFRVEFGPPSAVFAGWLLLQLGLVFCFEAFPEELVFRGYVFTNLAQRLPHWVAVIVQAVLFMGWAFAYASLLRAISGHGSWGISLDRAVLFVTFGVTLALLRLWTGSLWASVGFHLAYQTVVQLLVSGRLTVLRIPAGTEQATALVFLWFFPIVLGGVTCLVALIKTEQQAHPHRSLVAVADGQIWRPCPKARWVYALERLHRQTLQRRCSADGRL